MIWHVCFTWHVNGLCTKRWVNIHSFSFIRHWNFSVYLLFLLWRRRRSLCLYFELKALLHYYLNIILVLCKKGHFVWQELTKVNIKSFHLSHHVRCFYEETSGFYLVCPGPGSTVEVTGTPAALCPWSCEATTLRNCCFPRVPPPPHPGLHPPCNTQQNYFQLW